MSDQTPQDPQDEQETTTPEAGAEAQAEAPVEETPAAEAEETPEAEETRGRDPIEEAPTPAPRLRPRTPRRPPPRSPLRWPRPPRRSSRTTRSPLLRASSPPFPGADLEVDIVVDGDDRGNRVWSEDEDPDGEEPEASGDEEDIVDEQPITAQIQLADDARYRATGKRKTAIARVILKPGTGAYTINGRTLDDFFPRATLQKTIRQPLETVGYEDRMDVIARMHGGGVSAQAGALRHGISRALLEADPNLRTELKRRGFLTRDARAKERKKAGLKKARKKPQFSQAVGRSVSAL